MLLSRQGRLHFVNESQQRRRFLLDAMRELPVRTRLDGPVLIVWARDEKLMPPEHAVRLAKHFDNASRSCPNGKMGL